ncbi:Uncharacterised protein [Pragia fontium]|uniref:hypothetical protein n=1 Tax=Pragia fontium TaxID=82985 RepID=UPI000DFDE9A6|nr:hypothetical protein [Pragia fontium]SUB81268.1 Uncharacterised protein [Pragia fontium]
MALMRFFITHFFKLFFVLVILPVSTSYGLTPERSLTKAENAIFSLNLVLTENAGHSIFPPTYRMKKLEEITRQNGEWMSSSLIEYNPLGHITRLDRREKNRRGESVTKIYQDESGQWIKSIKWLIKGKESDVGKMIVRYQHDQNGRIIRSELMNSEWMREYIYNDDEQLTEIVEKQQVNNGIGVQYTVKKYYYNARGFVARRDFWTGRNHFVSTLYFDYNEKNTLERITAEAIAHSAQKKRGEKVYSYYDQKHNWLQAEWGTEENKFIQNREIDYY